MSTPQPRAPRRGILSILWFPVFFAIVLPIAFETAFHAPQPHGVPIAVVGPASQVREVAAGLAHVDAGGFDVRQLPSAAVATAAVRGQQVAAAWVAGGPAGTVYLARAAAPIRANYLQGVFAGLAGQVGRPAPPVINLAPLAPGDSGTGLFFFVFPLMMTGLVAALVLVQLPDWRAGRRAAAVAAVGAIGTTAAYLTTVTLHVLPDKPLLLVYGFLLTQIFGQLMVGIAPLLRQYFLPFSLTFALILSVPSSGGTVTPDLLPTPFRYLSDALPLAQAVKITRSVAYFHNAGLIQPTLLMLLWAAIAAAAVATAWLRQPRAQRPKTQPVVAVSAPPASKLIAASAASSSK